jgi:hypothetical protein
MKISPDDPEATAAAIVHATEGTNGGCAGSGRAGSPAAS